MSKSNARSFPFVGAPSTVTHCESWRVEPAGVRLLINGQEAYHETEPSSAAPWLALFASRERRTVFRNLLIKGKPTIPCR